MTYDPNTGGFSQTVSQRKAAGPLPKGAGTSSGSGSNPFLSGGDDENDDDRPETVSDRVEYDALNWVDVVSSEVAKSLVAWGKQNGYSKDIMGQIYNKHADQLFHEIQIWGFRGSDQMEYRTGTPEGLQEMVDWAINWFGGKTGFDLARVRSGGGGGGGGGGGRSGPSAQDIRNQFDIKELTNAVNEMNRAMVFEDHKDAKTLATRYVDAVVATRGEKKIDFATFVEGEISNTARFKAIYRAKPEHLSWQEYMGPYLGAARSMVSPDKADDIAVGAAQFGASPQAFQARLQREEETTGSAPFIQGLEGRMRDLNSLFKG